MSEDATKDIGQKYGTNPTIETVVQMLAEMRDEMRQHFGALESRLDRVESLTLATRAEFLELRADFRELKAQLKEHFPSPVK